MIFEFQGDDSLSRQLLDKLMQRRKIYLVAGAYRGQMVIRFVVCSRSSVQDDIEFAWNEIKGQAEEVIKENRMIDQTCLKMKNCEIMSYGVKDKETNDREISKFVGA